ncbi:hypothetical protein PPERSA_00356 [Pseudocohnilembus persalinus]|uniref:Multi antimicrobial extrusion protein n=1 Tax=Pseudocohnilembus persalinus TaxID=266149 RepID=A0A0V0QXY9_PSEPJ|nr:hypothetical protein PPERSA_00356 [Pseudocohnilembus persalinus]|eukprot:KRX07199.1 hypothetical protein PPERSA_00356 [Pseudocohnilembus persalinus]
MKNKYSLQNFEQISYNNQLIIFDCIILVGGLFLQIMFKMTCIAYLQKFNLVKLTFNKVKFNNYLIKKFRKQQKLYDNDDKKEKSDIQNHFDQVNINDQDSPLTSPLKPTPNENLQRNSFYSIKSQQDDPNLEFSKLSFSVKMEMVKNIFQNACFICFGTLLQMFILSINIHFVGTLEDPLPLSSLGFAILITNCMGGMLLSGFNQGCGSFVGRAHGKNEKQLIQNYFNKGLLTLVVIYIVYSIIMVNCDYILIFLGQNEDLSYLTRYIGSAILPGVFLNYVFDLLRNYLNGQEIYKMPMIILASSIPFHYIICSILFGSFGLQGAIYATNITYTINFIAMLVYLKYIGKTPILSTNHLMWNYQQYFKENSAIALPLQIDVLGFEINSILVGYLNDMKQFGAQVSFSNYSGLFFSVPIGIGVSIMLATSNAIGRNKNIAVKNYYKLSYICALGFGLIFMTIQFAMCKYASNYYTSDEEIQYYFQLIMYVYAPVSVGDFVAQALAGYMKAIGKSKEGLKFFILAYYVIGIPASAYFGLGTSLEVVGFWVGFGISIFVVNCLMIYYLSTIDVDAEVHRIYNKLLDEVLYLNNKNDQELADIKADL